MYISRLGHGAPVRLPKTPLSSLYPSFYGPINPSHYPVPSLCIPKTQFHNFPTFSHLSSFPHIREYIRRVLWSSGPVFQYCYADTLFSVLMTIKYRILYIQTLCILLTHAPTVAP